MIYDSLLGAFVSEESAERTRASMASTEYTEFSEQEQMLLHFVSGGPSVGTSEPTENTESYYANEWQY